MRPPGSDQDDEARGKGLSATNKSCGDAITRSRSTFAMETRSSIEALVTQLWTQVLGVSEVGPEANFFDLGGHSLLAKWFIDLLADALEIDIPLMALFDAPVLHQFAECIDILKMEGSVELALADGGGCTEGSI
jgi:hypothetical protein